ncbi:hypothetical protein CMI38_02805 [Candidatus Pacearchaeota archaeon]|jgi:hypothetical protein|nr:hypothetical protein [Candidatus Pacearchaeota archaeon]|tara:strand:+ start:1292 stop:1579 length:288 start_codon:yes stop_codon:yes gene_type:complete
MSIRNLKNLVVGRDNDTYLDGKPVNLSPIGLPLIVEWTESESIHLELVGERFLNEFDLGWDIPDNVDAYVRSPRNSKPISGHTLVSHAVQFYKIN